MDIALPHTHMPPGTRPEIALLLSCARTRVDSEHVEQIRTLLREDINWQYLMQAVQAQGVTPLLYRSLQSNCLEAVSPTLSCQLRRAFSSNPPHHPFFASEIR